MDLAIIIFAVELGVLPATGMGSKGSDDFSLRNWAQLKYAILPIVTMSMVPLGIIMRSTRSAVAEVLAQFSESPENQAALVGVTQNGIAYTPFG